VPQTVDAFQETNAPISIALALDASGSVKPFLEPLKEAARTFVAALRPSDPLALVQFADGVTFAHWLSTNRQTSTDAINAHQASGGTALWDALHDSIGLLERQSGRKAVVVVTDGRDENNPGNAPAAGTRWTSCWRKSLRRTRRCMRSASAPTSIARRCSGLPTNPAAPHISRKTWPALPLSIGASSTTSDGAMY
jgi:Mg-chelatase subunit ChlD